ncbi:hypothetical protein TcasGA2_TC032191 [Tribolium castaneum]|uniref:Uncharacterized protein n=1 Tax=Tribolium castaneum TaxID=7070 RepID=A0A139WMQ9_TRICA|nr:hypothetical protein TcasGA2_TC032191 [Tribolium castaneum]
MVSSSIICHLPGKRCAFLDVPRSFSIVYFRPTAVCWSLHYYWPPVSFVSGVHSECCTKCVRELVWCVQKTPVVCVCVH